MTDDEPLVELLHLLKDRDYRFVCVTPATHARVVARPLPGDPTLRDIFGWNRPFTEAQLEPALLDLLHRAAGIEEAKGKFRSLVRVASLGRHLFLHSAYPTDFGDSVFFGPDTYRFARFVLAHLPERPYSGIVEMGAGSGAVAILAAERAVCGKVALVDVNPAALRLAGINASAAGVEVQCIPADVIPSGCDLVIANPPYMVDPVHRTYRDGGALFGGEVAVKWADNALRSLVPGGAMLLYTGAAVIGARMPVAEAISALCSAAQASFDCEEIDPDIFGEELETPAYREVERIAAVGVRIGKAAR